MKNLFLILMLFVAGKAYCEKKNLTDVSVQFLYCDVWNVNNPVDGKTCFDPHYIRRAKVFIAPTGKINTKFIEVKTNDKGLINVRLPKGKYDFFFKYEDSTQFGTVGTYMCINSPDLMQAGQNACRNYLDITSFHSAETRDEFRNGRTLLISGRNRKAVIKFYERRPV